MLCIKCGTENEDDALFCKKCGSSLVDEYKNNYTNKKNTNNDPKPKKNKAKTKTRTKVKKVKDKSKNRRNVNNKNYNKNNVVVERRMSIFQKIFVFFLILFIILLLGVIGVMGYGLYENYAIDVPNVVGMSYSEAELTLAKNNLKIEKKVVTVDDTSENGIVIKQNKKTGSKVIKNTVVKVTVGTVDDSYTMPNFVGKDIDSVTSILDDAGIKYTITIKEVETGSDNVVLVQSVSPNKKIKMGDRVKLIVSKVIKEDDSSTDNNDDTSESNDDTVIDNTINNTVKQ